MGRLYPDGGHLHLVDGGRRVWSTDGRPATLLPESAWLSIAVTISFPDFIKRNAYLFDLETDPITDATLTSCASFSTILPGEWGYNKPDPRNLPDQVIGSVSSAKVNYIDVQAFLSRTTSPTNYLAFAAPNLLTQNAHGGPGNSFQCEKVPSLYSRGFDVRLDGTSIILRRYQSVSAEDNGIPWADSNDSNAEGWTYGGGSNADKARLFSLIQAKGPGGNVNKKRGASNQCSLNDTSDYRSKYTGTLLIRPGFLAP